MDTLVGRKNEKEELLNLYHSDRAEFLTLPTAEAGGFLGAFISLFPAA